MTSEYERNDSDTGVWWIVGGVAVFVAILVILGNFG
jgi:hypothetical protein